MNEPSFGDELRAARESAGLSIAELARRIGTSRAVIHGYENGSVSPTVAKAQRLLECVGHTLVVCRRE
jgi:predicted transcriptional regulator